MKYIYHFCTIWQPMAGQTGHSDGIANLEKPIVTYEDYLKFKAGIARQNDIDASDLTIMSLTLIHSEPTTPTPARNE